MTDTQHQALLPCPFCNSENVSLGAHPDLYVSCDDCGSEGPWVPHFEDNPQQRAVEYWNTRPAPASGMGRLTLNTDSPEWKELCRLEDENLASLPTSEPVAPEEVLHQVKVRIQAIKDTLTSKDEKLVCELILDHMAGLSYKFKATNPIPTGERPDLTVDIRKGPQDWFYAEVRKLSPYENFFMTWPNLYEMWEDMPRAFRVLAEASGWKLPESVHVVLHCGWPPNQAHPHTADGLRKFKLGDRVTKTKGSSWTGKVVGFYSTALTPVGYAVESDTETGSVQIYPEAALGHAKRGG